MYYVCVTTDYIFIFCFAFLVTLCIICTLVGGRDHQDHESLHQHDSEEAVQCEICVQLRHHLDQVMDWSTQPTGFSTTQTDHGKRT